MRLKSSITAVAVAVVLISAAAIKQGVSCNVEVVESSVEMGAGQELTIPIKLTPGEGESVSALQFDLGFDPLRLALAGVEAGDASGDAGKNTEHNLAASGQLRVIVYGMNQNQINEGVIVNARFTLMPYIMPGVIPITLSRICACDGDANLVPSFGAEGIVTIIAQDVASDLSTLKVFPNPFKPSAGHLAITFNNLTLNSKVKIYTMTGELVRELKDQIGGFIPWDGKNEAGKEVASGIYIYLVTNDKDEKKKGRIVVVK